MKKMGLLNIGDSPILEIEKEKDIFLKGIELIEKGILDDLSERDMTEYLWQGQGPLLTVERNNGDFIKMDKQKLFPLIEKAIHDLEEKGAEVIYMHCTSHFPEFEHQRLFLEPGALMKKVITMLPYSERVAVITPTEAHRKQVEEKWRPLGLEPVIFPLNPVAYTENEVNYICVESQAYQAMILDCASYNLQLVEAIRNQYKGLILQPLSIAFSTAATLLK